MKIEFEIPDVQPREEMRRLFAEKVAGPFNEAFAHIRDPRGNVCFRISILKDEDIDPDAPNDIAYGYLYDIEGAHFDDYVWVLMFKATGEASLDKQFPPDDQITGGFAEVIRATFEIIRIELEKVAQKQASFAAELAKVEAALRVLNQPAAA